MPFTDRARIHVQAGHGGGGCLSFRREKYIPRGGPDGGNGGRGGNVVIVADDQQTDLTWFRHAVHHKAQAGGPGEGRVKRGRAGDDLEIVVPPGTRVVRDDMVLADLEHPGDRVRVARGGEGGVGNRAFRSSTHQAPRETVPGTPGEETWLTLELRLAVDVALVGLPNSGKSALLVALTGAGAVVAPYPHSTKEPALGPLTDDEGHLFHVIDLPGLAEDGTPRRDAHLQQLERARVVLVCVDARDEDAAERLARVREGVAPFMHGAAEWVVATHADPAEVPAWADLAVDSPGGGGVAALRARLVSHLQAERAA
ncbi:MAG: GTPase [Thermoleophilia bacterium]